MREQDGVGELLIRCLFMCLVALPRKHPAQMFESEIGCSRMCRHKPIWDHGHRDEDLHQTDLRKPFHITTVILGSDCQPNTRYAWKGLFG